jgi:nucleotide-binding universal stress UspA family protein
VNTLPSFGSILLTTDLSPEASSAYAMVESLRRTYNSSLTVLACIDTSPLYLEASAGTIDSPTAIISPEALQRSYADVEASLKNLLAENFPGTRAHYHIIQAPSAVKHSIVTFARNNKPDLIVMASHGRSGVARAIMGSVTEHVLRHAKLPVLVVPAQQR